VASGYNRPPPPFIASTSSWEEEDPTDEGIDRTNELATVVSAPAAAAAAAVAVEAIPEAAVEEDEEPAERNDASSSTLPPEGDGTEGTVEAEAVIFAAAAPAAPLEEPPDESSGREEAPDVAEFVPGLGASGDEIWEEAAMEHPAESSEDGGPAEAPLGAPTEEAVWAAAPPLDDPSERSSLRQASDHGETSERFADEDATESSRDKERAAPYVVGAAVAAAAATAEDEPRTTPVNVATGVAGEKQLEVFHNEFDAQYPPAEMRKPGPEDDLDRTEGGLRRKPKMFLLIILIVVVIIVLVTVIPIVLVNRNKSKDIPTGPTASPREVCNSFSNRPRFASSVSPTRSDFALPVFSWSSLRRQPPLQHWTMLYLEVLSLVQCPPNSAPPYQSLVHWQWWVRQEPKRAQFKRSRSWLQITRPGKIFAEFKSPLLCRGYRPLRS